MLQVLDFTYKELYCMWFSWLTVLLNFVVWDLSMLMGLCVFNYFLFLCNISLIINSTIYLPTTGMNSRTVSVFLCYKSCRYEFLCSHCSWLGVTCKMCIYIVHTHATKPNCFPKQLHKVTLLHQQCIHFCCFKSLLNFVIFRFLTFCQPDGC